MKRILTALVLIPLVGWAVLNGSKPPFLIVVVIVGLAALHEFDTIAAAHGLARSGVFGMAAGLVLLAVPDPSFAVLVGIALVMMLLALRRTDLASALPSAAVGLLGVVYIFGALRCGIGLREINPHWLMVALLVSWAGDTAALYTGRAFGKHSLAPRISPAKTWEGAIGSVCGGVLAAGVYAHYLIAPAPLAMVLGIAAAANIAGQIGDLCESAFKRGAGLKDSGATLPGHGGWLDRMDSSLFSIPVVYGILKLALAISWI
jgi:phosphatidate cytidylyltransferase